MIINNLYVMGIYVERTAAAACSGIT